MKKTYKQPMTDVVSVELTQLMAGSAIEAGFTIGDDLPSLGEDITSGNLSRDLSDLWD